MLLQHLLKHGAPVSERRGKPGLHTSNSLIANFSSPATSTCTRVRNLQMLLPRFCCRYGKVLHDRRAVLTGSAPRLLSVVQQRHASLAPGQMLCTSALVILYLRLGGSVGIAPSIHREVCIWDSHHCWAARRTFPRRVAQRMRVKRLRPPALSAMSISRLVTLAPD